MRTTELLVILDGRESVTWDESEGGTNGPFDRELLHHKVRLPSFAVALSMLVCGDMQRI